ncbi:MAG: RagB/SusD family nutrient uptake outer membrane protein [Bacteroidales bacterium]|nr:RagB/SusD family nutrient uptake outer membrane protein [Bacteroidales bacterium]
MRKIIPVLLLALALTSCSDFLEERQITGINEDSVYESEEMLESGIYGILGKWYSSSGLLGEGFEFLAQCSALIHHGLNTSTGRTKPYYTSCLLYSQYSSSIKNNTFFRWCYDVVNASNVLIDNLPASPVDEGYKREIEAEARFYRAWMLFRIVRVWGDCPLRTAQVSPSDIDAPRTPFWEVYAQIVEDLHFAEQYMRSPARVSEVTPGKDRASRYAATAVLSSVYTTIGSLLTASDDNFWDSARRTPDFTPLGIQTAADAYTLALETAQKLIPGNPAHDPGCPYRLAEKFGDLFAYDPAFNRSGEAGTYTAWSNPEKIFTLPVTKTTYSTLATFSLPPYAEGTAFTGDLETTGFGRWRPNRWVFQKWCETYPGEKGTGRAANVYVGSADPRLDLTLYHTQVYNMKTREWTPIYPNAEKITSNVSTTHVFPYLRKYWSRNYACDYGEADLYVMRLAEVYFNAAEACAELGRLDEARAYVEAIHARARRSVADGAPEADAPSWPSDAYGTVEEMREALFWERIFEFLGEGHEWDETHRHGATFLVNTVSKPKNLFLLRPEQAKYWTSGYLYPCDGDAPYQYSEDPDEVRKGLLYAYPNEELNYNSTLTSDDQNDFWYGI